MLLNRIQKALPSHGRPFYCFLSWSNSFHCQCLNANIIKKFKYPILRSFYTITINEAQKRQVVNVIVICFCHKLCTQM